MADSNGQPVPYGAITYIHYYHEAFTFEEAVTFLENNVKKFWPEAIMVGVVGKFLGYPDTLFFHLPFAIEDMLSAFIKVRIESMRSRFGETPKSFKDLGDLLLPITCICPHKIVIKFLPPAESNNARYPDAVVFLPLFMLENLRSESSKFAIEGDVDKVRDFLIKYS